MARMIKKLTSKGRHDEGNPHKNFWVDKSYIDRLAAANEVIISANRIGSWDNCRMFKILTSVRKHSA